jgi:hypothetical protein
MSTRTVASRLEALIEQVAELEDLGRKLQLDDELSAAEAAARLDDAYRTWYSSALTLLPDDLKERFRFEYEGDWIRFRVKHFLQEPRQRSTFYDSLDDEETKKTLNPSPW